MNTSYEKLSFYNTFFGGSIDGDNIVSTDFYGNKQIVGVTMKKYQDTLDLLNTYYNKLIELGVIEKEKTPEDIAKEQQQMMQAMFTQMQMMQEKLDNLQKNTDENIMKGENNENESYSEYVNSEIQSLSKSTEQPITVNRKSKNSAKFSKQSN